MKIKNPVISQMIDKAIPNKTLLKEIGTKRIVVNENKFCFSFMFKSRGDMRGVRYSYSPSTNSYTAEFFDADEDGIFVVNKQIYGNLCIDDLFPTFQCVTGLMI